MIALLKYEDPALCKDAMEALGRIGDDRAIEPLIMVLKDKDRSLYQGAVEALRVITGQNFGSDYKLWTDWWKKQNPKSGKRNVASILIPIFSISIALFAGFTFYHLRNKRRRKINSQKS